jgi:hypothetical protein
MNLGKNQEMFGEKMSNENRESLIKSMKKQDYEKGNGRGHERIIFKLFLFD